MTTVSLRFWHVFATLTIGFVATGCAAEASDSTAASADGAISAEQDSSQSTTASRNEDIETRREDDVPVLTQDPGPHLGDPSARGSAIWSRIEGSPPNPNPCPDLGGPAPQVW
jgi:hypothetical protein